MRRERRQKECAFPVNSNLRGNTECRLSSEVAAASIVSLFTGILARQARAGESLEDFQRMDKHHAI